MSSDLMSGGYCCERCFSVLEDETSFHSEACEKVVAPPGTCKAHRAELPMGTQPGWEEVKVFELLRKAGTVTLGVKLDGLLGCYEVVFDRIVIRTEPQTSSRVVKMAARGERFWGAPYTAHGEPWLRILRSELGPNVKEGVECGWALIHENALGLGRLLSRVSDTQVPDPRKPSQQEPGQKTDRTRIAILTNGSRGDLQPVVALAKKLESLHAAVKVIVFEALEHDKFMRSFGLDVDMITESSQDYLLGDFVDNFYQRQQTVVNKMRDFKPHVLLYRLEYVLEAWVFEERFGITAVEYTFWPQMPAIAEKRFHDVLNRKALLDVCLGEETLSGLTVEDVLDRMGRKRPILYAFSEEVAERQPTWPDPSESQGVQMFGYWLLDGTEQRRQTSTLGNDYFGSSQDEALNEFLESGETPVYIGLGSMNLVVGNHTLGPLLVRTLKLAKMRGIILGSYTGLDGKALDGAKDAEELKAYAKENVLWMRWASHELLMPRCSVIVHHGGNGTTAASLRAGKPTVITPVAFDQPFWGNQVVRLGVGVATPPVLEKELTPELLAHILTECSKGGGVFGGGMSEKAAALGSRLRAEDGTSKAAHWLLSYARLQGQH